MSTAALFSWIVAYYFEAHVSAPRKLSDHLRERFGAKWVFNTARFLPQFFKWFHVKWTLNVQVKKLFFSWKHRSRVRYASLKPWVEISSGISKNARNGIGNNHYKTMHIIRVFKENFKEFTAFLILERFRSKCLEFYYFLVHSRRYFSIIV